MTDDPFNLQRFVDAQNRGGTFERALRELRAGRKESCWMWFIFPQVEGLSVSPNGHKYAIRSLEEAEAYLYHPSLNARLILATITLVDHWPDARQVFGEVDYAKFHASMTLFALAATPGNVFEDAINRYFSCVYHADTYESV